MTIYNYVRDRDQLEELVAAAVIADVDMPAPVDSWSDDVRAVATAKWDAVRSHPNAVSLVLTRRTVSSSSFAAAERLVDALSRASLSDADLLAAFRAVLSVVTGSAQVEHGTAGEARAAAGRIGALAGEGHPRLAALAEVSQRSTAADDFAAALDMLIVGITSRGSSSSIGRAQPPTVD